MGWQQTRPDPAVVDAWQPGDALCAVMGWGLDCVDVDPRNGGSLDALNGALPDVLGVSFTCSGGVHAFVRSLGVRTTHGRAGTVLQGIDIQAGVDGAGHGFVFIPPTVRTSKATGQPTMYRWGKPIDVARLAHEDTSGEGLRRLVTAGSSGTSSVGVGGSTGDVDSFMRLRPWQQFDAGAVFSGGRHNGVIKLVASLHGRGGWQYEDVRRYFDAVVWPEISQTQGEHEYSYDEFLFDISDEWTRLEAKADAERVSPVLPDVVQITDVPALRLEASELPDDHMRGDPPPTPPYVLDDLLREGELAALISEAKAGKSLLVLDRVLDACAAGRRVIYFDAENGLADIHTRRAALGHADIDLSGRLIYNTFPSVVLDVEQSASELLWYVAKKRAQYGRIDAVVFDTASRFLSGAENDAEPWLSMYRLALLPLKREGIAVLRLDHLGKDHTKGARGSSAKSGDVDTVWELYADPPQVGGATRVVLSCAMQRAGTHPQVITLNRSTVGGILGHRRVGELADGMIVAAPESIEDRIVRELDRIGAPVGIGRDKAKKLLFGEITAGDHVWAAALRRRKAGENLCAEPVPKINKNEGSAQVSAQVSDCAAQVSTVLAFSQVTPVPHTCAQDQQSDTTVSASTVGSLPRGSTTAAHPAQKDAQTGGDSVEQTPLTKTQQKKLEREQARSDAAGALLSLPALVDRSGTVTPVSVSQATDHLAEIDGPLTVDVETTGYPIGHEHYRLRTIQLGTDTTAVVLDATDDRQRHHARTALAAAPVLHAHSATADLAPLAHDGLIDHDEAWSRMQDTVIPAKLADPQSTGSDPGLKQLSDVVLGESAVTPAANDRRAELFKLNHWLTDVKVDTPPERSGWAQVDSACETMIRYAASDVLDTAALPHRIPAPPDHVWQRERLAQRMTARVAFRGLPLDAAKVAELTTQHQAELDVAAQEIQAFGIENPGSDKQVADKLTEMGASLPRTDSGRPSVARDAIEPLKDAQGAVGGLVRARLEFERHEKLLSSFLKPYNELCVRGDGRVRPTVYTLGADTGRMSCVRPNLQQVPRSGGIRSCITAEAGSKLISADFASVEVRVMAALSQDPDLMYQLAHGLSVHEMIAEQVFGPQWTKSQKYVVKRGVFGWAYGGGVESLAKQIGVPVDVMQSVIDTLAELAPTYVQWSNHLKASVRNGLRQFQTYSGRIIHLDTRHPHKAANYCVQGTARELLVDALIRWSATPWGDATLLPVHDELIVMVPEADADEATRALVACMETDLYGVHIAAEASEPSYVWRDSA